MTVSHYGSKSGLHLARTISSTKLSASLLRLVFTMYPAALTILSMAADVAGMQWCFAWRTFSRGNRSLFFGSCQKISTCSSLVTDKYLSTSLAEAICELGFCRIKHSKSFSSWESTVHHRKDLLCSGWVLLHTSPAGWHKPCTLPQYTVATATHYFQCRVTQRAN